MTADERQRLADEALEASITEWEKKLTQDDPDKVRLGSDFCPLCKAFSTCAGCPVAIAAEATGCRRTPYHDAEDALIIWSVAESCMAESRAEARAAWRAAAQAEIDFLKSLRRPAK